MASESRQYNSMGYKRATKSTRTYTYTMSLMSSVWVQSPGIHWNDRVKEMEETVIRYKLNAK